MTRNELLTSLNHLPRRHGGLSMVKRILVIDDHPLVAQALTSVLEKDPMLRVVDVAADGADGLLKYRRHRPDLLIVDLQLPGLHGLDVVRRVRVGDAHTPILVFSARNSALAVPVVREAGADGYLDKTRDDHAILEAVRTLLAGRTSFPGTTAVARSAVRPEPPHPLTQREVRIMSYLAKGDSNKDIAVALSLSNKTVSSHKMRILSKLGLRNVVDLSAYARSQGHAD